MSNTWIVVADACRARIFSADKPAGPLNELETLSNPQARLHEGDLVSDRGGRDTSANGGSHGLGEHNAAKHENANRFANEVCEHLERGRLRQAFGKLYVIGAPNFLGLLRKHQSASLRGLIGDEIAKDLTTQSPQKIRAQLPEYL
ncbi:MAG: host attachment protein [Gammaproteobacteria bacterium]|nr:host attachment protein [Gammaproteobacteria bacterium]MCB1925681.1 host attachment protein [Gammaproteobacteria bacterium]